jgi:chaperone BCS1
VSFPDLPGLTGLSQAVVWTAALSGLAMMLLHKGLALPARLGRLLRDLCATRVTIDATDPAYLWLSRWLAQRPGKRYRHALGFMEWRATEGSAFLGTASAAEVNFGPDYGSQLLWLGGWPVLFTRTRDNRGQRGVIGSTEPAGAQQQSPGVTLSTLGRRCTFLQAFIRAAVLEAHAARSGLTDIYVNEGRQWQTAVRRKPRSPRTLFLRAGVYEDLAGRVQAFRASRARYDNLGIPWRLGVLLEGPPGTGKSSTVGVLAGELGLDVACLSLAEPGMSDGLLLQLLTAMGPRTVLLLEDVDVAFTQTSTTPAPAQAAAGELPPSEAPSRLTLSGLLNALDGLTACEGRVLVMTTNYPERLDERLLRPGRVDHRLRLGLADQDQLYRMFRAFFPGEGGLACDFSRRVPADVVSPARVVQHLREHWDDPVACHRAATALAPEGGPCDDVRLPRTGGPSENGHVHREAVA